MDDCNPYTSTVQLALGRWHLTLLANVSYYMQAERQAIAEELGKFLAAEPVSFPVYL